MANNQLDIKFPKGGIFFIIIAVVALILFSKSTVTIGPGEGGVLFETLGALQKNQKQKNPYY